MIKDSGDRTEFETGAKRDMHAGKGRITIRTSAMLSARFAMDTRCIDTTEVSADE